MELRDEFIAFRARTEAKQESYDAQLVALRDSKHEHQERLDLVDKRMDAFEARLQRLELRILGYGSVIYVIGMVGQGIAHHFLGK